MFIENQFIEIQCIVIQLIKSELFMYRESYVYRMLSVSKMHSYFCFYVLAIRWIYTTHFNWSKMSYRQQVYRNQVYRMGSVSKSTFIENAFSIFSWCIGRFFDVICITFIENVLIIRWIYIIYLYWSEISYRQQVYRKGINIFFRYFGDSMILYNSIQLVESEL